MVQQRLTTIEMDADRLHAGQSPIEGIDDTLAKSLGHAPSTGA
jgi:hypothetical protein